MADNNELAKYIAEVGPVEIVNDLDRPMLGAVVQEEVFLTGIYAVAAIASVFYLPFGLVTAVGIGVFGFNDVKATLNQGKPKGKTNTSTTAPPAELAASAVEPENTQETPKAEATDDYSPQFVRSPWGEPVDISGKDFYKPDTWAAVAEESGSGATTAVAEFRAPSRAELLAMPVKERAEKMLDDMALAGCDLWAYINDSVLVFNGKQQSGKTTLAMVVVILEAALYGKNINYITSDGDIYPIAFSGLADGAEYYPKAADALMNLQKGQGGKTTWVIDEVSKQPNEVTERIWEALLTGFVKTRDTVRLITHGTTSNTMGLPTGWADQAKGEATVVSAKRAIDVVGKTNGRKLRFGGKYPSGEYRRQEFQKDGFSDVPDESLMLPDWLQFAKNDEDSPCYVRSLLAYFPELDVRAQGTEPKPLFPERETESINFFDNARRGLENLVTLDAVHPSAEESTQTDSALLKNAQWLALIACEHITQKSLSHVTLAKLLADNYQAKTAFKINSSQQEIRDKGRATARNLIKVAAKHGFVKIEQRGDNVNIFRPEPALFV